MEQSNTGPTIIRDFGDDTSSKMKLTVFVVLLVAAIALGVGVGYVPNMLTKTSSPTNTDNSETKSAGIVDKKTFKDSADGVLREGGIDGEGNFHLERPGGESQNVYLTSTTVDLSLYIGKKVKVWGQTFTGEKAGWLMDVGSVETLK